MGRERDDDEIVARLAEESPLLFRDAGDFERQAVDLELAPDHFARAEELVSDLRTDHRHAAAVFVVGFANVAAELRLNRFNIGHVRRDAFDIDIGHLSVRRPYFGARTYLHADALSQSHPLAQVLGVGQLEVLIAPVGVDKLLEAGDQPEFVQDHRVGAQVGGHRAVDVAEKSLDHRGHGLYRHDAEYPAEQRQDRPQLMRPHKRERYLYAFQKSHMRACISVYRIFM